MAWNDTPPDLQNASWDSSPPTPDELQGKSVSGFAKNAVSDVKGTITGLGHLAKGLVTDPAGTIANMPGALVEEGKRIGLGGEGGLLDQGGIHPINAVNKFGNAFYDKPLSTALDVAPFISKVRGLVGLGGEAGEVASTAEKVAPIADNLEKVGPERMAPSAPEAVNIAPEASDILKNIGTEGDSLAKKVPETSGSFVDEAITKVGDKVKGAVKGPMDEVKNYLEEKYAETAKKPGFANTAADYLKEHGQNMTLKELGAAPGQIRKIGVDRAHDLADYALDHKLAGPEIGTIGREKIIPKMKEDAGGAVGGFRQMATERGAIHDIPSLTNQIRSNLDAKYLKPGMYSGQKGTYLKALEELKKTDGTAQSMADKVTEMFKEAKNQNPLGKPTGPLADVARQARQINHALIAKALSPSEMAAYENALEDYGALTQIHEFVKRRGSVEAGGRLGPGSGISRAAVQKFLDAVGYRTEAKVARRLSDVIRKNPEIATRPRDLFRNYVDEAAEAVHEMGDNMQQ